MILDKAWRTKYKSQAFAIGRVIGITMFVIVIAVLCCQILYFGYLIGNPISILLSIVTVLTILGVGLYEIW